LRVAVTGASGFVGRHVVAALLQRGILPVVTLRAGTPVPEWLTELDVVRLDLSQPPADPFAALRAPDILLHLAWGGLPNYRSPHHVEQELPAQYHFLRDMVSGGLGTLLVAGTCLEYGMQSGALAESLDPHPAMPYAIAKDSLRQQLDQLCAARPFHLTWARLFYLFGDGQSAASLLPQLRRAVADGASGFDMSGGEQLRDYLPVALAARHLVSLALTQRSNGVVNVCSGQAVSVRTMVERWIDENGWSIRMNLGKYPFPDYEPMAFWGDTSKLQQCLEDQ
jgi:nucleoside-diphosphate-sugar epimerase